MPSAVAMSRTARGSGAVIVASGTMRIWIAASFSSPKSRPPRSSSSETVCVGAAAIVADHVLEPAAVENGLGNEVEKAVDLLRRHADRASIGCRRCGCRFRGDGRVGGDTSKGAGQARGEVLEQIRRGIVVAGHVPAQGVRATQQRLGELCRELPCRACFREHVLHHVREIPHGDEPDHRGAALDRVGVAEDRVDRVRIRAGALEREQGVDHAVEPFVRLVAKELEEFGLGVWLDDGHARHGKCGEEALDIDDSDEPGVVKSGACKQVRLGLLGDRRELADVCDLVDREAGSKPAVLGDEEALRMAVAR